ncbi:hypothetical protein ACFYU5_19110 [Nocardia aobensis]|uniref:Uncharacterized protein n=1 Tax=Nocardia aobensis TaxID=257277 RepID=A0ABW6P5U3_9NOCA
MNEFFADVSEFQCPVDDSYPYRIFSFRSNDGTYEDHNFEANYRWATAAADAGRLDAIICYFYWRANWSDTVATHIRKVESAGGPHPKMISMIDLESGGNPEGDQSDGVNHTYWALTDWLGTTHDVGTRRVIGYANRDDFNNMWPTRPDGLLMIGAGYGENPNLPGQIAHQYTDGQGYGGGLPEGAPPFGNCDMNSADGLSSTDFAAKCGITGVDDMALSQDDINTITNAVTASVTKWLSEFIVGFVGPIGTDVKTVREQLTGSRDEVYNADGSVDIAKSYPGWSQLGNRTVTDAIAALASRGGVLGAVDTNPQAQPKQ